MPDSIDGAQHPHDVGAALRGVAAPIDVILEVVIESYDQILRNRTTALMHGTIDRQGEPGVTRALCLQCFRYTSCTTVYKVRWLVGKRSMENGRLTWTTMSLKRSSRECEELTSITAQHLTLEAFQKAVTTVSSPRICCPQVVANVYRELTVQSV